MNRIWLKIKGYARRVILISAALYVVAFLVGAAIAEPRWDLHVLAILCAVAVAIQALKGA
jgi:hypothetical protein